MSTDTKALAEAVEVTRSNMRVVRIEASHTVRSARGEYTMGLHSAFFCGEGPGEGSSVEDARLAQVLLGLEASIGALRNAFSDGAINAAHYENRVRKVKHNTLAHLSRLVPQDTAEQKLKEVS